MKIILSEEDLVALVGDALLEFCPRECGWGHEVDVGRRIGPGDLERYVAKWAAPLLRRQET